MIVGDFCYELSSVAINIARFWTEHEEDGRVDRKSVVKMISVSICNDNVFVVKMIMR